MNDPRLFLQGLVLNAGEADQEIDYLWTRPKTPSAYWFFLNRYYAFFGNLMVTIMDALHLSAQVRLLYPLVLDEWIINDHFVMLEVNMNNRDVFFTEVCRSTCMPVASTFFYSDRFL